MIYHITSLAEWEQYQAAGRIEPESLRREGFIHCSTQEFVTQVASFYFTGRQDLVILEINEARLTADLRWEGKESRLFPHVYGVVPLSCVERDLKWQPNENGEFEFPFKPVIH